MKVSLNVPQRYDLKEVNIILIDLHYHISQMKQVIEEMEILKERLRIHNFIKEMASSTLLGKELNQ